MKRAEAACRRIRAATTESQVVEAVRAYLASVDPCDLEQIPYDALTSSLVQTEEAIHAALQAIEDVAGRSEDERSRSGLTDEVRLVLTTAARRVAALSSAPP